MARAARHDEVEQVALSERLFRRSQQALLQARELRQPEGEARVVTDRAEVAEMIGDALELQSKARRNAARGGTMQAAARSMAWQAAQVWATAESPETRAGKPVAVEDRHHGEARSMPLCT